ncbi:hypothetical protein [Lysinibacillus sp. K60]|uniref:hypothetical protein n=1 Tax=Lysinibacillus sp. K60 TaxID=2720027 RepID=UPI001C8C96DC|nr:hypothetical protein [Lysinibacillus sp. K60]MBX8945971.1 hypothetical protein [Lysinibacillus sp. K60]
MIDRSAVKWNSMMLPEHLQCIKEWRQEEKINNKALNRTDVFYDQVESIPSAFSEDEMYGE